MTRTLRFFLMRIFCRNTSIIISVTMGNSFLFSLMASTSKTMNVSSNKMCIRDRQDTERPLYRSENRQHSQQDLLAVNRCPPTDSEHHESNQHDDFVYPLSLIHISKEESGGCLSTWKCRAITWRYSRRSSRIF